MKFLILLILWLITACTGTDPKEKQKKQVFKNKQEAESARQARIEAAKRRPIYNSQVMAKEGTGNPADDIMGEDYNSFLAATGRSAIPTPKPTGGQGGATEATKPEILEISGNQRKKFTPPSNQSINSAQESLLPQQRQPEAEPPIIAPSLAAQTRRAEPPAVSYYRISTSSSYNAQEVSEIKAKLQNFGNLQISKSGEGFSLKVTPPEGLKTESEARSFMNRIIASSFFDVYIEKTEPTDLYTI